MADRVDAPVHTDQPPPREAIVDLVGRETEREQLPTTGHPRLPGRQTSQENVEIHAAQRARSTFTAHRTENVERDRQH